MEKTADFTRYINGKLSGRKIGVRGTIIGDNDCREKIVISNQFKCLGQNHKEGTGIKASVGATTQRDIKDMCYSCHIPYVKGKVCCIPVVV